MSRIRRIWQQLRADRRKFGMACGCLALALLFWARLIVITDMPRTAIAEPLVDEGRVSHDTADRSASHNEPLVNARSTLDSTPNRDPFAPARPRTAPAAHPVAE